MRNAALLGLLLVSALASATYTYVGDWKGNYKTYGPANVKITGTKVSAYIKNSFTGLGYQIEGTIVNRIFTGTLSSNGRKWVCVGTGTYGVHSLHFVLKANGVPFAIDGSK